MAEDGPPIFTRAVRSRLHNDDMLEGYINPFSKSMRSLRRAYKAQPRESDTLGLGSRPYKDDYAQGLIYPFAQSMRELLRKLETIVSCDYCSEKTTEIKTEAADLLTSVRIVLGVGGCGDAAASVYKFMKNENWD